MVSLFHSPEVRRGLRSTATVMREVRSPSKLRSVYCTLFRLVMGWGMAIDSSKKHGGLKRKGGVMGLKLPLFFFQNHDGRLEWLGVLSRSLNAFQAR